jgi:hypothetical protein
LAKIAENRNHNINPKYDKQARDIQFHLFLV